MNTKNNRRKKDSQEKIEKAFIDLIQTKQIEEIKEISYNYILSQREKAKREIK